MRETKWIFGALAAALWIVPAAAQTSTQGAQSGTAETSGQHGKMGTGSTHSGSSSTSDTSSTGATGSTSDTSKSSASSMGEKAGEKAKSMGQQASSEVARTLAKLHAGNQEEIEAGTWMKEHATNDKVKDFAKKMVDDHGSMDKDLMSYAQKHDIDLTSAPKPADASKEAKGASLERIKSMEGAQADRSYMKMMVDDHTKDVKETKTAAQHAKQAKNDDFAKLLDKSSKKMEDHLKDAQKIQRDLSQRQARTPSAQ